MSLQMRSKCARCERALSTTSVAFICSHECTYCENCALRLQFICLNCQGELVRRPKRTREASMSDCDPAVG
jgi:hypothetical protein